ncbi:stalk domain-containing protein [Desulfofalx alkaliphila]|uniref:stalk domain-containing protein n=1 Tax=Desulfofalx alkaliphila TaxID=105483 RepID=UPI0006896D98|nr:copper amine oxidase N-terminal domain-containing protein [Desulfofalx alkaliphila]
MKRLLAFTVCLALFVLLVPGMRAVAAQQREQVDVYEQKELVKSVVFVVGQDHYFIDNKVPGIKMDAAPFIEQGRTFVPIRFLSNALGVENENIAWESPRVTLSEPGFPVVELAVGQKQIKSDGKVTTTDVAPLLRDGRTFLPARFVAEALGYQVDWDPQNGIVLAYPKGQEKPDYSAVVDYIGGHQEQEPPQQQEAIDVRDSTQTLGTKYQHPWFSPTDKVVYITVDDLKKNDYKLFDTEIIHDIRFDDEYVYVKRSNPVGTAGFVFLVEDDKLRQRDPDRQSYSKDSPFESKHSIINDRRDGSEGWPTADITKVDYVMVEFPGAHLMIENPLKGGN